LTTDFDAHPADALALQLDRVAGLIRTLGELYSPTTETFAAGSSFIAHGLVAATNLITDAQHSLESVQHILDQNNHTAAQENIAQDDEPLVFPPTEHMYLHEDSPVNDLHEEIVSLGRAGKTNDDQFAQSYLELLRKLTAAEVFAAEQQALAPPGSGQNLLPLLRSLREEFQKLNRVA
jgi:hypothetical protein